MLTFTAGEQQPTSSTRNPLSNIQSHPSTSSTLQGTARQLNSKLPVFGADSPYLPSGVKTAIQKRKRPSAADRESMVERIVDRCREIVPNLARADLDDVAKDVVKNFPASFKDTVLISDHGSDGLARQMKVKYDNDKRPKNSKTATEKAAPSIPQAFGCTRWSPACPSNQTEESQENIMQELQAAYKLSRKDRDWKTIKTNMEESFYLQRQHINGSLAENSKKKRRRVDEQGNDAAESTEQKSITDHKENWPFLFTSKGLNLHYKLLTGIDFKDKLHNYVTENGNIVIDFLAFKNEPLRKLIRKMLKADRQGHRSTVLPTLLKMVLVNFGENPQNLMTFVEVCGHVVVL